MKFIVNNNDGIRIQVNAYNKLIEKFRPQIRTNQVKFYLYLFILNITLINISFLFQKIILHNMKVIKSKGWSLGNIHYDLNLQYNSSIKFLENFNIEKLKPIEISFTEIPKNKGLISMINN